MSAALDIELDAIRLRAQRLAADLSGSGWINASGRVIITRVTSS